MSDNTKSLKFSAVVDDKAIKQLNSGLNDIKKTSNELNKNFDNVNKKMKEFGTSIQAISKNLRDFQKNIRDVSRDADSNASHIDKMTRSIMALNAAMINSKRMLESGGGGGMSGGGGNNIIPGGTGGQNWGNPAGQWAQRVGPTGAGGGGALPPGGGGGVPPNFGMVFPPNSGSNNSNFQRYQNMFDRAQSIGAGISSFGNAFQSMKTTETSNQATIAQSIRGAELRRAMRGDASSALLLNQQYTNTGGDKMPASSALMNAGGRWASNFSLAGNAAGGMAQVGGTIAGLAYGGAGSGVLAANSATTGSGTPGMGFAQGATGGASAMKNVHSAFTGGSAAEEASTLATQMQNLKDMGPYTQIMLEQLQSSAGMRLQASRRINSQVGGAVGTGAGYGLDMGESLGFAVEASNQFGSGAAMGKGGIFGRSLAMETKGFDRSAASGMIGTMGMAAGGDNQKAQNQLEDIFAAGLATGLEDVQFFEKIGQAVAANAYGHGGASSGTAFGAALTGGLNSKSSMMDVQSNIRGASGFDQLMGGNNYFKAVNMELSKNILGDDASGISVQALGRASFKELLDGSKQLDSLGVSKGQRDQLLQGRLQSIMSAYAPEDSMISKKFQEYGGDLSAMFKGAKGEDKKKLRAEFANIWAESTGGDYEEGLGLSRDIEGIGTGIPRGKNRKNMKSQGDGTAMAQLKLAAQVHATIMADEKVAREKLIKAMDDERKVFEQLRAERGSEIGGTGQAVDFLNKFIQIVTGKPAANASYQPPKTSLDDSDWSSVPGKGIQ